MFTQIPGRLRHGRYVDFLGGVGRVYGGGFSRRGGRVNGGRVNPAWRTEECCMRIVNPA